MSVPQTDCFTVCLFLTVSVLRFVCRFPTACVCLSHGLTLFYCLFVCLWFTYFCLCLSHGLTVVLSVCLSVRLFVLRTVSVLLSVCFSVSDYLCFTLCLSGYSLVNCLSVSESLTYCGMISLQLTCYIDFISLILRFHDVATDLGVEDRITMAIAAIRSIH